MGLSLKSVIYLAVSLLVVALVMPLGLGLLGMAGDVIIVPFNATGVNETVITLATAVDPSILTLLTVLIPILAVIGIAVAFVKTE